jgi:23S rRNA (uracil1939-C5)-methyltransferase
MIGEVQANIESMAFKGYGVARVDGKVLFIPYSVIGDKAWIKMTEKKKNYSIGKLSQLIEPSPWRVNPPCPFFGQCGGCHWQHINDSIQINLKKEILKEVLKRLGSLKEIPPITVVSSPQPYGYRARIQLKVKGEGIGYYQEKSHRVVDIDHCPIAHPLVNQIISSLRKEAPSFFRMEEIEINVSPEQGKGILILHPLSLHSGMKHFVKEFLQTHPILKGIAVIGKKGFTLFGDPYLNFTVSFNQRGEKNILRFRTSPASFFQVNLEMNQALIRTVLEFSDVNESERVLDLYAGVGNFTLPLAITSKTVWGIEESQAAVEDARFNAEKNGIKNCNFMHGRVEDILKHWSGERPDLMILDPPRTGCKTVLDQVVRLKPKKIVYVSCEPTTFARDLRLFSEREFHLQSLSLVDMFPQTYHMEVVGLLVEKTKEEHPSGV